jgi:L-fuculose-phosphate aldolase
MISTKLKEEIAKATLLFWKKGLSAGRDAGDTSLRDPETNLIYICPQPTEKLKIRNWGNITSNQIVVININNEVVDGSNLLPSVEAPMHIAIYEARPEINATEELAGNVVKALGKNNFAALMRNHGAVCIGKDFEEAFTVSDFLEKSAKTVLFGTLLGGLITHNKLEYTPNQKLPKP